MRINGEWLICADGDVRPVVRAELLRGDNSWLEFELLVDTGADRTVVSSDVLQASRLSASARGQIGGVGGVISTALIQTQIRFLRDDGVQVVFRGEFPAVTDAQVLDMSVLGRDILSTLALVVDRRQDVVALLGGHHFYTIHSRR